MSINKKEPSFMVVGTVRNVGRTLRKEIESVSRAIQAIGSVQFLLIESDSDDNTVEVLQSLAKFSNFQFISMGNLESIYPNRIERLTACRNEYLKRVYSSSDFGTSDFLVVADFDGMNSKMSSSKLQACLKNFSTWDVLCANQNARYYDVYALRHNFLSPNNPFEALSFYKEIYKLSKAKQLAIYSRMVRIPKKSKPIDVISAFGGFAVYKFNTLRGVNYTTKNRDEFPESEHVVLHRKLIDKGYRIAIDPQLINSGWNIHNIVSFRTIRFLRFWLLKLGLHTPMTKLRRAIKG